MKTIKYLIFILLTIMFYACEEEAKNIDLPNAEPKLVVHSYLSPDDSIVCVILEWSKPVYGPNSTGTYKKEANATIKISDGTAEYTLTYDPNSQLYFSQPYQINITEGKTYKLFVETTKGEKVTSECIIPKSPNMLVEFIRIDSTTQYGFTDYKIYFKVTNKSTEENKKYLSILFEKRYLHPISFDTISELMNDWELVRVIKPNESIIMTINEYDRNNDFIDYQAIIYQTDEAYYWYKNSLLNGGGDNPFGEPSITYSNIENGLGVFCAYNRKIFPVNF